WDDKFIPKLSELTRAVHQAGGKVSIQLQHNGKVLFKGLANLPPEEAAKVDVVGPSAVPWVWNNLAPREMTKDDIKRLVEAFSDGARRARDAGFDAVEFHGAHGYLVGAFLSPFTNRRTDEYGGSVQNRARFACEIVSRARQKVGPDFPIDLRVSGCDYLQGGIAIEDTVRQAPMFVEAGANALHVSGSAQETTEWQFLSYLWPDGAIVHLAEAVKKAVRVPVITVGKIWDPAQAERILSEGKADFVALGRALLADPEWANKAREGRDIRRCIYCNNCLSRTHEDRHKFGGLFCTVNPTLFRERDFALKPASQPKKVLVAGGGIAGMEAARTLAERGHQVTLYERSDSLGGQWNIASGQELKDSYRSVGERLTRGLKEAGVKVALNTEVTARLVEGERPDAVVVAAGAVPRAPDVPGCAGKNVVQAVDVLTGKVKAGKTVVVVGGRLVGMETAIFLAKQGKKVSLVTLRKLGENGKPPDVSIYRTLRDRMIELGVFIYPDSPVYEILDNGVYVNHNRELLFLAADTVVFAVGMKSENGLVEELKGVVKEIYTIGDAVQPRDGLDAIREGAEVGRKI
ncbi:MAG: FAD-dependent oxidoreductase, partial [Chloroflexota bacterium]